MKKILKYNTTRFTNEAILYGLRVIAYNFLALTIMLIICIKLSCQKFGILFLLFFSPMRIVYGGFHSKNPYTCLILTIFLFFICAYIYCTISSMKYYLFFLLTSSTISRNCKFNDSHYLVLTSFILSILTTLLTNDTLYVKSFIIALLFFNLLYILKFKYR